ncbi:MAG TPA: 5-oxoprolinase subunit PxpB [Gemmatimonadaceae bacterium]|nr:5-oxoprolinase subunit PxpB [Gemmatimonadaceae bacterium]
MTFAFSPLADRGITVKLGDGISAELSDRVVEHARAVTDAGIRGITDVVPSYSSLGVFYDPLELSYSELTARLERVLDEMPPLSGEHSEGRLIRIPVVYDGEDLDEVCRKTKLTRSQLVEIHSSREYRVLVVGFVPGWAYLGQLDPRLIVARRESPRKRVPPGSVAIAESQTGIYPSETPGGWNLIGTTTEKMFDVTQAEPSLLRVGDKVRFEKVE